MTELSFLLDLVLTEKLSKSVKGKVLGRIKEIEECNVIQSYTSAVPVHRPIVVPPGAMQNQAPSTIAAFQRHAVEPQTLDPQQLVQTPPEPVSIPVPPAHIAQTPAAAAAMSDRAELIAKGMSGKLSKNRAF